MTTQWRPFFIVVAVVIGPSQCQGTGDALESMCGMDPIGISMACMQWESSAAADLVMHGHVWSGCQLFPGRWRPRSLCLPDSCPSILGLQ